MGARSDRRLAWAATSHKLNEEFGAQTLRHCHRLNGQQFAVTPGALKACCSATHDKGAPAICSYSNATVSTEDYLVGLGQLIRANQRDDGPCVGCRYLVSSTLPKRFVARYFTSISLHDFSGCNANCIYCAGSEYKLPEDYVATFDHEQLFADLLVDRLIRPVATTVFWGGGEPTLVDTFDRTVAFLSEHRVRQTINTSGVRFSESVERALSRRTASVCISVDSGTLMTFLRIKRNRHFEEVWNSIRRYAATGADMTAKYIILSMNCDLDEVAAFIRRCSDSGVRRIRISVDARSVFGARTNIDPIGDRELAAAAHMRNTATDNHIVSVFDEIWLPSHLDRIGELGGFNARRRRGRLGMLRDVSSIADLLELGEQGLGHIRRKLA